MVKKYPDLERGESASQTGRDHIPPRVFKEMTRLTKQKEKLEGLLAGISPFNAKSKAEEIGKLLDSYIPAVEKMQTLLTKYNVTFTQTVAENKRLKKKNSQLAESLEAAQEKSVLKSSAGIMRRRSAHWSEFRRKCWIGTHRAITQERSGLLKKYYDNAKDNAAFDRCIDVMAKLIQRYGPQVLKQQEKKACEEELPQQHFKKAA